MSDDKTANTATPRAELQRQIMNASTPKNEREWWARNEIERLRESLAAMVEIANRRWRALPPDSHEKAVLANARAALRLAREGEE
jgi:hypothetical protein